MKQVLSLNGGINKDVNPLYIDSDKGEVTDRRNCRVHSADGGRVGINVSIKGMQEVSANLPAGTNIVIGYKEDKERDRGVFFNYNSNGNDGIYVFTGTSVINLGVANGVLDFDPDYPIQADILGDYCVFTDNRQKLDGTFNPPRKVNIAGSTSSLAGLDSYDIQLAVRPPSSKPTVKLGSDDTKVVNKLVGKTFQFATFYRYNDNTYSVLSPYSDLVVSSAVFSSENNTYEDSYVGNFVNITYDAGTDNVSTVVLVAREGNIGSWFVVKEYEKSGDEEEYSELTYSFYNDVARQAISETEVVNLYSDVPLLAKSVVSVQNRIALGNVLKGYDKETEDPYVDYSVEYSDAVVETTSVSLAYDHQYTASYYYVEWEIPTNAELNEGDVISVNFKGSYLGGTSDSNILTDFAFEYSYSYRVTAEDIATGDPQNEVQLHFTNDIDTKNNDIITAFTKYNGLTYLFGDVIQGAISGDNVQLIFVGCRDSGTFAYNDKYLGIANFVQETPPQGVSTHKAGSYKNVGVLFYDEFSRTSGVVGSTKVYVPFMGEREYASFTKELGVIVPQEAKIAFTINSATTGVPSWAKYYRFAITESVNYTGVYPFVSGDNAGSNAYLTFVDGHWVIAINMPTNFQYEFNNGDYLLVEDDTGSEINTIRKGIIGTRTLITVSGTEYSGYWLIVPKGDEALSDYESTLMYIYRPKSEVEDLIYYESSDTFEIVNGEMQTLTGYVGGQDAWWVKRKFEWDNGSSGTLTSTPTVEDFYINVDDAIRAYSKGRAVVEFDTTGQKRLQDFVWSFNYLDNTKINGMSTFNSLNRKQLDEKDGEIQSLQLVGDVVKVLQDNKETSLYVGKAQISDASGILQVVKSNDFIGTVYPSQTDFGTRYPFSVVKYNRTIYYWDGDRGQVIRSSANGQFPISDYGMKSEFLRIKSDIDDAVRTDSRSVIIRSLYDVRNDEFVITFDIRDHVETWAFKEGADAWVAYYDYTDASDAAPDFYGNIGELSLGFANNSVWKFEQGTAYNTFFGDNKTLSVSGVVNMYSTEEKCLRALEINSNRACLTTITSPVTSTRELGQKSYLYAATYRERAGNYASSVFKNVCIAGGGENLALLHRGDDIVGRYIELKFEDSGTTEFQLRNVGATFSVNK